MSINRRQSKKNLNSKASNLFGARGLNDTQSTQMEYLSLPVIQEEICSKINGLENVKILRPGYAIESFVDPKAFNS